MANDCLEDYVELFLLVYEYRIFFEGKKIKSTKKFLYELSCGSILNRPRYGQVTIYCHECDKELITREEDLLDCIDKCGSIGFKINEVYIKGWWIN